MNKKLTLQEKLQNLRDEARKSFSDYDNAIKIYSEFELLKIHMEKTRKKSTLTK